MWEDMDSRKKSKGQKLFSQGVVILMCLILAAQAVFFAKYLIDSRRADDSEHRTMQEAVQDEELDAPHDLDNVQENVPDRKGPSAQAHPPRSVSQASSSSPATSADRPDRISEGPDSTRSSRFTGSPTRTYSHDGWKWDRVELNSADSAALDALPGIGPYYARQILAYRDRLGFYADISQLLDIRGFDTARLNRLTDRIYIDPASQHPLDLYTMPIDSMAAHPYIGPYAAKGIDRLRRTLPRAEFSFRSILENNILTDEQSNRLSLYFQTD